MASRRIIFVAVPLVVALWVGAPARAAETSLPETVRIATEGAFPPYTSRGAGGQLEGFEIDLGNAICAHAVLRCEWVVVEWSAIIPGLVAPGTDRPRYDVIMAGMGITPLRARSVTFSDPYFNSNSGATGMYVGTHSFQTPDDSLIAVQADTIHEDHLKALGRRMITFSTAGAALDAVLDGRADLTFGSPDFLETRVFRSGRVLNIIGHEPIDAGGVAAAFRKGDTALRRVFNQALRALIDNGTLDRLNRKWFTPTRDI